MVNLEKNMSFKEMYEIDVSKYVEKNYKKMRYLSWSYAYKTVMLLDPDFSYYVHCYNGLPYIHDVITDSFFVKVSCKMFGKKKTMIMPVLDSDHNSVKSIEYKIKCKNGDEKLIKKIDSFMINTTMQRCLVKCIALFGIGLSLYSGEDTEQYMSKDKSVKKSYISEDNDKLNRFRTDLVSALTKNCNLKEHNIEALNQMSMYFFSRKPDIWDAENTNKVLLAVNKKLNS